MGNVLKTKSKHKKTEMRRKINAILDEPASDAEGSGG